MSDALIRAQIKIILEAVTGIGVVYDYFRWRQNWADWLDLMTSGNKINGWMFERENVPTSDDGVPIGQIERVHHYNFLGVYEIDDPGGSGKAFQAILDAIFDAFKSNRKLNGTAERHDFIQVTAVGIDDYGEVSYHYAGLSLMVHERVNK